jgi:CO/xanthine dehydrogenase FAD-binding subunit
MGKTRDILPSVRIPKQSLKVSYRAHRNSATDLPVLNVCAVRCRDRLTVSIGARPARAVAYRFTLNGVAKPADESARIAKEIADAATFDSNTRATAQYRRHLCRVLVGRAINDVLTEEMV